MPDIVTANLTDFAIHITNPFYFQNKNATCNVSRTSISSGENTLCHTTLPISCKVTAQKDKNEGEKQPNGTVVSLQLLLLQHQMSSLKISIVIFNLSEGIFDSGDIYRIYFTSTIKVASFKTVLSIS